MEGRIPPHSIEAEKSVLGAALLSKDALFDVVEVVKPEDFYDANHKEIFKAMLDLHRKNSPVDALTVSEELKKKNSLNMVGGRAYIASLSSGTPTITNAVEYGKIVAEKASIRRMIDMADDIMAKGYDESMEAGQMLDYAESGIFEISQSRQKGQYTHIKDVLLENIEIIDKASQMDGGLTGVTTGFKYLDQMTSGLQKSDLIILAARPAMGKTAFALSLALNAAVKGKASVMVFSMEMAKEQLGQRLLSMESKVPMQSLKTGKLERRDWDDINIALDILSKANIHIDDTAGINIMEMKSKCRRLKAEEGLDLIVIDYLQLMQSAGGKQRYSGENRQQVVSDISRALKIMAKELNVPVVCLSQLSRGPESRTDKRPMLSDLRESGAIEQDADIVLFLYRDDYYNEDSEMHNLAECIIAKNRHGETGKVELQWLPEYTTFSSIDRTHSEY